MMSEFKWTWTNSHLLGDGTRVSSDSPLLTSTLGFVLIYAPEWETSCALNPCWLSYETDQRQRRMAAGNNLTDTRPSTQRKNPTAAKGARSEQPVSGSIGTAQVVTVADDLILAQTCGAFFSYFAAILFIDYVCSSSLTLPMIDA